MRFPGPCRLRGRWKGLWPGRGCGALPPLSSDPERRAGRPARTGAICSLLSSPYHAPRWEPPLSTRGYRASGLRPAAEVGTTANRRGHGVLRVSPPLPAPPRWRLGARGSESRSSQGQRWGERSEAASRPPSRVLRPSPGLSGRSCPRPPRLGREWPGGGRRAERVGRSRLSPSAERLARAGEQMVAVLSCPLGRRTSDLPWAPRVVISSPHTETPVPEGQYSPLPTFRRGKGVGTEKGFSKALSGVGGGGGGLLASGGPALRPGAQSRGCALPPAPWGTAGAWERIWKDPRVQRKAWMLPRT